MQRDVLAKGRSLGGSSDLTLLARIKPGFVESLETVTYKTRIKRVLELLHGARAQAHEYQAAKLLSDSIERVGLIQSVRVAVLEPGQAVPGALASEDDRVMLSVSFDGPWEAYIRVLWEKVGSLLDLIFVGTVDYVTAYNHTFEQWRAWCQRVQVETGFFYGPPDATARDVLYHRRVEQMLMRGDTQAHHQLRAVVPSAEKTASQLFSTDRQPSPSAPKDEPPLAVCPARMGGERISGALQALSALYRLADVHRPGTPDGDVLQRAALDLLREFVIDWSKAQAPSNPPNSLATQMALARSDRFKRQIDWLFPDSQSVQMPQRARPEPASTSNQPVAADVLSDLQGGIVRPYPHAVTHGALLLLAFPNADVAAGFLDWIAPQVTRGNEGTVAPTAASPYCSIAFTAAGLHAAGMPDEDLDTFPEEFRQGMAARAGLLGDVRHNHPRRWRLPRRGVDSAGAPPHQVLALEGVHAVLQLRLAAAALPRELDLASPAHPAQAFIERLRSEQPGVQLLSLQAMARRSAAVQADAGAQGLPMPQAREAFGYVDGLSQPEVEPDGVGGDKHRVHLGEVVCGHTNAADNAPDPEQPDLPAARRTLLRWTRNGSFMVLRKYRQFPDRLQAAVTQAAEQIAQAFGGTSEEYEETVYGKLMGRLRDGTPLAQVPAGFKPNAYDYSQDKQGQECPLHSHVRLANPREVFDEVVRPARTPRLMRRGMSYLPTDEKAKDADFGLYFMAYCASISEQFEVIQRWLMGANATGKSSGHACPIVGVPDNGLVRHFRFELTNPATNTPQVFTVKLETPTALFEEPAVVTQLQWGLYTFAPSISGLQRLAQAARARAGRAEVPWKAAEGRQLLAQLRHLEQTQGAQAALQGWKAAIEDPDSIDRLRAAALFDAIRQDHGGVLNTPYGVLVCSRELIHEVMLDRENRYSIKGQNERMVRCFRSTQNSGEIYLGMDASARYHSEATEVNNAITALSKSDSAREAVFQIAFNAAKQRLHGITAVAALGSRRTFPKKVALGESPPYEVSFDARELIDEVLVALCDEWFGIRGSDQFEAGPTDWHWNDGGASSNKPLYPGHFTALSRYMFQPHPYEMPKELAQRYGKSLIPAMAAFVKARRQSDPVNPLDSNGQPAPVAAAIFGHTKYGHDDAWVARTMVGVMMGFVAPIIGSLLNVLREWTRQDQVLWRLRTELAGRTGWRDAMAVLYPSLEAAMRMRPMPQLIWRTATQAHRLGPAGPHGVDVAEGAIVVMALASGTQQSLTDGEEHCKLMFGGDRKGEKHPTHACPGYEAAIDALLGTLTALLSFEDHLARGPIPYSFIASGKADEALGKGGEALVARQLAKLGGANSQSAPNPVAQTATPQGPIAA